MQLKFKLNKTLFTFVIVFNQSIFDPNVNGIRQQPALP